MNNPHSEPSAHNPQFRLQEQARLLYMQAPVSNVVLLVAAALFYALLSTRVDSMLIPLATLLVFIAAIFRILLWYLNKRDKQRLQPQTWLRLYLLGSGLVGIGWSIIYPLLYFYDDPVVSMAMAFWIFGLVGAAAVALSVYLPAFLAYTYPQMLTLAVVLLLKGDTPFQLLAGGLIIYALMMTLFTRNLNLNALKAIDLQQQNETLIGSLNEEIAQRETVIESRTAEISDKNESLEREISERTLAQNQLQLFRKLVDQSSDGLLVIDPDSAGFLDVNKIVIDKLGYTRDELLHMHLHDIEQQIANKEDWQALVSELRKKDAIIKEGAYLRKDGQHIPVEISARYLVQDNQPPYLFRKPYRFRSALAGLQGP